MTEIHLFKAALDEIASKDGNRIVLRGVLDPTSLAALKVDDYQREPLPTSALSKLWRALADGESLPDIELAMRGQKFDSNGRRQAMTNYHDIWGPSQKQWSQIDYRGDHILTVLTVCAWAGMFFSFVFGVFSLLTRSDAATIAMLISLAVWMTCGICAIRIRRRRRRFLKIQA